MIRKIFIVMSLLFSMTLTSANAVEVTIEAKITGLYVAFFNRAADQEGLQYWTNRGNKAQQNGLNVSDTLKDLSAGFATHPTFISTYSEMDNKEFVEAIFRNALGRDGDREGIEYWSNFLNEGLTRSDMVATFVEISLITDLTQENYPNLTPGELASAQLRQDLITNKVTASLAFTHQLGILSNVVDSQDPENDPAYLASIQIISEVTEDVNTVSNVLTFLVSIINAVDPITSINVTTLNVNTTFKGSLATEKSDSYRFTAKSTGEVFFSWNEDNVDISVHLYEGTNPYRYTDVADDYDGFFSASIVMGRTYTVKILNTGSSTIDQYKVNTVTTNDDRAEAVALVPNKSYTDKANDQNDRLRVYNFIANSTGTANVRSNWFGDSKYAYTYVYENGIYKDKGYGSDTDTSFDIVKGRTYSIVQYFNDTDSLNLPYNIEVITTNDTRGDAVSMVPNKPYFGTLNEDEDSMAVYNFTASSDGVAIGRASWTRDSHYAYITVYENGIYRKQGSGSSSAGFTVDIKKGRNYTVNLTFIDTDHADTDYGIEVVTTNDSRGDAVTISQNTHINTTRNETKNFLDVYNFTATSSGTAMVKAAWPGSSNYSYLSIYENGIYQDYQNNSGSITLKFSLIENRKYSIVFSSPDTDFADEKYSLALATTDKTNAKIVTLGTEYSSVLNENTDTLITYSFTPTENILANVNTERTSYLYYTYYIYEDGIYKDYWNNSFSYNFIAGHTYTIVLSANDTNDVDTDITFSIKKP